VRYAVVLDLAHRHLGHRDAAQLGRLDVVVAQHRHRGVRGDPVLAAGDVAAFHHRHAEVGVVGDVDPLPERHAAHVDGAVVDHHRGAADVYAVQLRVHDGDVVEDDAVDVL